MGCPIPAATRQGQEFILNVNSISVNIATAANGRQSVAPESAAAAAALLLQPDLLDGHNSIDRFAHVVDGQSGDADGGQRLHLDAGAAKDAHGGLDAEQIVGVEGEIDVRRVMGQWMAEGNEVAGALGGHDAGEASDFENVALAEGAVADEGERGRRHADAALARASRSVSGLALVSTMRLAPCSSKWLSSLMLAVQPQSRQPRPRRVSMIARRQHDQRIHFQQAA